ncbi:hypothetical protein BDQ17DRAFT_1391777 [Cyathus striatus]|nr:hypothetical protein BDQ17DRAFT_1391777 [Cyathus striatus]
MPLSVASSSDFIHHHHHHHQQSHQELKQPLSPISSNQLYLRQPHTLQVIQLVECSPPPRRIGSAIESSSASSSSSCDYSEEYSESAPSEEEEEVCTSYCSSDEEEECEDASALRPEYNSDTYSVRMKRILAWRENFSAHMGASFSEPILPSSLKRKMSSEHDDNLSHSSKRSRSQSSLSDVSMISLGAHSCAACDKSFGTQQALLQHGKAAGANEACSVAVEYEFE